MVCNRNIKLILKKVDKFAARAILLYREYILYEKIAP